VYIIKTSLQKLAGYQCFAFKDRNKLVYVNSLSVYLYYCSKNVQT